MNNLPQPPRVVRRRWKSRLGMGLLVAVMVVAPQGMIWGGFWLQRTTTELRTRGVETVGWVGDKRGKTSSKDSARVLYSYRVGEATHGVWESVSESQYPTVVIGQEVVVLYLPDHPATGAPAVATLSSAWSSGAVALWIIAALLLLIGLPLWIYLRRREGPLLHLARHGVPAPATIVSAVRSSAYRGVEVWRVSYQFDLHEERQLGTTSLVPALLARTFAEGTPSVVLHDPDDAGRFELLPAIEAVYEIGDGTGDQGPGTGMLGPGTGDQGAGDGGTLAAAGLVVSCLGIPVCGLTSPVGLALSVVGLLQRRSMAAVVGTVVGLIGVAALLTVGTEAILHPQGTGAPVTLKERGELGYLFPGPDGELGTPDDLRLQSAVGLIDASNAALDAAEPHAAAADAGVATIFGAENIAGFPGNRTALVELARQVELRTGQSAEQYLFARDTLAEAARQSNDADVAEYYLLKAQSLGKLVEYLQARETAARLVADPEVADAATLESRGAIEFDRAAKRRDERDVLETTAQEVRDAHPEKFAPQGADGGGAN